MAPIDSANLPTYLPSSYFDKQGSLTTSADTAQQVAGAVQTDASNLPPAEAAVFLQMVRSSTDLTPTVDGAPPANLAQTLSRCQTAAASVESFEGLAESTITLAAILIREGYQEQAAALDGRLQALELSVADSMDQAKDDTDAATALRAAAVASLSMSCVASAVQIIGAGVSIGGSLGALKSLKALTDKGFGAGGGSDNVKPKGLDDFIDLPSEGGDESGVGLDASSSLEESDFSSSSSAEADDADLAPLDVENNEAGDNEEIPQDLNFEVNQMEDMAALEAIKSQAQIYQAVDQVANSVGAMVQAGAQYESSMGQANSQTLQADAQLQAAFSQEAQALATTAQGVQ